MGGHDWCQLVIRLRDKYPLLWNLSWLNTQETWYVEAVECNPREPQWFCNNYLATFCHINSEWTEQDLSNCVLAAGWLIVGICIYTITSFMSMVVEEVSQALFYSICCRNQMEAFGAVKVYTSSSNAAKSWHSVHLQYGQFFVCYCRKRGESSGLVASCYETLICVSRPRSVPLFICCRQDQLRNVEYRVCKEIVPLILWCVHQWWDLATWREQKGQHLLSTLFLSLATVIMALCGTLCCQWTSCHHGSSWWMKHEARLHSGADKIVEFP